LRVPAGAGEAWPRLRARCSWWRPLASTTTLTDRSEIGSATSRREGFMIG